MTTQPLDDSRGSEPQKTLQITVSDLLGRLRHYHDHLAGYYAACAAHTQGERVILYLQFLIGHEKEMANLMVETHAQADANVLDTWIKAAPGIDVENWTKQLRLPEAATMTDVMDVVESLGGLLEKSVTMLETQPSGDNVHEFLNGLRDKEHMAHIKAMKAADQEL